MIRSILVTACVTFAGCGPVVYPGTPEEPSRMLAESDAARPIELERGKRITLRLEANHSAAYRWVLSQSGDAEVDRVGPPGGSPQWGRGGARREGRAVLRHRASGRRRRRRVLDFPRHA